MNKVLCYLKDADYFKKLDFKGGVICTGLKRGETEVLKSLDKRLESLFSRALSKLLATRCKR
jgi:vacuolar-type H+-ATPase subunit E/Vma4